VESLTSQCCRHHLNSPYIDDDPFEFRLHHEGKGVHIFRVWQEIPIPTAFALELGEWLYNLRACLEYIMWATCAHLTEQTPPPKENTIQYPIYEQEEAWNKNKYRLKYLEDHHRAMLWRVQPFNSNAEANYLGTINRLARIDRHRRLTITTSYLAEIQPEVEVPQGCHANLELGERILHDGEAELVRITVSPWTDDMKIRVNPNLGIDPDIQEWAKSEFWRTIPFNKRMDMIHKSVAGEIATYEYSCRGTSRQSDRLTASYIEECDNRTLPGPIKPKPRPPIKWTAPNH